MDEVSIYPNLSSNYHELVKTEVVGVPVAMKPSILAPHLVVEVEVYHLGEVDD